MVLEGFVKGRNNNFNLLRMVAAFSILIFHSFSLPYQETQKFFSFHIGDIDDFFVHIFFVTSGFLVTASLLHRQSLADFLWARALRIFPALFFMLVLSVILIGLFFSTLSFRDYFTNTDVYYYFVKCLTLFSGVVYHLPGAFSENPTTAINGSLWTLPYEVKLYALLASGWVALKIISPLKNEKLFKVFISIIYISLALYLLVSIVLVEEYSEGKVVRFMFFAGSFFWVFRSHIIIRTSIFILLVLLLSLSAYFNMTVFKITYLASLPYIVFYLAYIPNGIVRKYNGLGDYSYGVYIYAFVIQQAIIAVTPNINGSTLVMYSSVVTLFIAIISWHFVEKKALGYKRTFIVKEV